MRTTAAKMKEYFSIKPLPLAALLVMSCLQFVNVTAQSNYVQHGDSGNYTTNGLPEEATLDGKVSVSQTMPCIENGTKQRKKKKKQIMNSI